MKNKESALFVVPTDRIGGAERVLKNLAESLSFQLDEVIVFIMSRGRSGSWEDLEGKKNIRIVYKDYSSEKTSIYSLLFFFYNHRKTNFKYVFSSHTHINGLLSLCRKFYLLKCDFLIGRESTVITDRFKGFKGYVFKFIYSICYGSHDLLICQTSYMKDELIKHRGKKISRKILTVNNPVNTNLIDEKIKAGSSICSDRSLKILYVGRLIPIKNIGLLVEAFSIVVKDLTNVCLYIVGDGISKESLHNLVKEKNISSKVKFIGSVDNPYVYMNHADIGVIPSIKEGFPNVILEMMYSGTKTIITTPCAGDLDKLPCVDVLESFDARELASIIKKRLQYKADNRDEYKRHIETQHSINGFLEQIKYCVK